MLEEKLKQASEETTRRTKRLIISSITALLCGVVVVVFLSTDIGLIPTVAEGNVHNPDVVPATEAAEDQSELRQQVKEKIRTYEEALKPELEASNLRAWNKQKETEIASLEDAALKAFSYGEYREAIANLGKLEKGAKAVLEERDDVFTSNVAAATEALSADKYVEAKLHISKALVVKPGDEAGLDLEQKVDALPKILKLLKDADVAQIENNIEKEYALVTEAYKLDPNRGELQQIAKRLGAEIQERQFQSFVARSQRGVERKELASAKASFQQAQSIFPQRTELKLLQRDIAALEHSEDLRRSLSRADKAAAEDNWRDAKGLYQTALKRHPNDKKLQNGLQLSTAVVDTQEGVAEYLERPERLSSPNIYRLAKDLLGRARVLARNSQSLAVASEDLSRVLQQMNKKVPVTVVSDNQTSVRVKGVGNVGVISKKIIHLRPGEYVFEGARQGYRSKIVKVTVVAGAGSSMVEIRCDEPI